MTTQHEQSGFALLLTIVVVSVVLAIGLSLLDITVKQLSLSSTARDSEVAFHAANAGIECALAARQSVDVLAGIPTNLTFNCVEKTAQGNDSQSGVLHHYVPAPFTWNNGVQDLCTAVDVYIIDAKAGAQTYDFSSDGLAQKTCPTGDVCTVVFSRGYNRACNNLTGLRTVQRELTIEL